MLIFRAYCNDTRWTGFVCIERQHTKLNVYDTVRTRTAWLHILVSREQGKHIYVHLSYAFFPIYSIRNLYSGYSSFECHSFSFCHIYLFGLMHSTQPALSCWRNNKNNIAIPKLLSFRYSAFFCPSLPFMCTFGLRVLCSIGARNKMLFMAIMKRRLIVGNIRK